MAVMMQRIGLIKGSLSHKKIVRIKIIIKYIGKSIIKNMGLIMLKISKVYYIICLHSSISVTLSVLIMCLKFYSNWPTQ